MVNLLYLGTMKTPTLFALLIAATFLSACDSTPRERQQVVEQEARNLDTLADQAAAKLRVAGRRAARFDSASRARNRQPLDPAAELALTRDLLGPYADLDRLTPATIEPAFVQFMQQVRARRKAWTQRDWDYATALSRRLNARFRALRLDIKGRDELHIRALQTEFTALETSRDVKDLGQAVGQK